MGRSNRTTRMRLGEPGVLIAKPSSRNVRIKSSALIIVPRSVSLWVPPALASAKQDPCDRPDANRRRGPRLRSLQAHRRGDRYSGGRDVARDEKEEITLLGKAVEEEKNAGDVVETLKMVGDKSEALFLLDRELGQRRVEEQPAG